MKQGEEYDIVIVGGGLAGSALATALAENGIRVLVLEREKVFKDRVRGEAMLPWGVPGARDLGVYERIIKSCGCELRWACFYDNGIVNDRRDLIATTSHQSGFLNFYHPAMQDVLLNAAETAGAEIRRGTKVEAVVPGEPATVVLKGDVRVRTRLVVGADGRTKVRTWGRFQVKRDPKRIIVTGVLLDRMNVPEEAVHFVFNPPIGQLVGVFPLGHGHFRCYFCYARRDHHGQLSGTGHVPDFIKACIETGAPADWYREAQVAGPLAAFEGADTWVDHPYQNGVVLVGDAAAASDPTWGCGLASTVRDVRVLRDQLLTNDNWTEAGNAYAREHDRCYSILHRIERWFVELLFEMGPQADARRDRAFQRQGEEPDRAIDIIGVGPDSPNDKMTRSHFFGED